MRLFIAAIFISMFILGCEVNKDDKAAIKIGDLSITAKEFEDAFQTSSFNQESQKTRRDFIDTFISRRLILKEAASLGLDKDPEFLKDIQAFWEQSLLKIALARKMNELAVVTKVEEPEIELFYQRYGETYFKGRPLSEVKDQIKWLIIKDKQKKSVQAWVDSLKMKTNIIIDYKELGLN